jgi:putative addiction module component (TIGR02574 family)
VKLLVVPEKTIEWRQDGILRKSTMVPSLKELGLDQLSAEDRLAVAEAIWESVARELVASPLPTSQRAELERRLADSMARPEADIPWEQIKARALARALS